MKHQTQILLAALLLLLSGCAAQNQAASTAGVSQTQTDDTTAAVTEVSGAETEASVSRVADASQMVSAEDIVTDDMVPVPASDVKDGVYEVTVDSSSSMFRVERCTLTVKDGKMEARMTMGGSGYLYVYPGTADEAAAADEAACIPAEVSAEGTNEFVFPVEALDAGIPCAAFSKNKELWYDRLLVFHAASLPLDAFAEGTVKTADSLGLADGTYTVAVTLSGGTGRSGVESPCRLFVKDGMASAEIVWSSSNYDYMKVDGEQIFSEIIDGHSVCVIPVNAFDHPLAVIADTTAMSTPHEIDYTLFFDSTSVTKE